MPEALRPKALGNHYKGSSCFTCDVEKYVAVAQNQAPPTIPSGSLITQFNATDRGGRLQWSGRELKSCPTVLWVFQTVYILSYRQRIQKGQESYSEIQLVQVKTRSWLWASVFFTQPCFLALVLLGRIMKGYKKKKMKGLQDSNKLDFHMLTNTLYQWIWVPITEGLPVSDAGM